MIPTKEHAIDDEMDLPVQESTRLGCRNTCEPRNDVDSVSQVVFLSLCKY